MKKNIIKKLELDLGKKTITLNIEQAKKLKEALDELFGQKVIKEVHEHHHDYYQPYWYWHYTYTPYTYTYDDNTSGLWCGKGIASYASYNADNQSMNLSLS